MTTATTHTPSRPVTERLATVLRLFDGCRGDIVIDARTLSGIGATRFPLRPPLAAVPLPVLDEILSGSGLRLAPATRSGAATQVLDLPMLVAVWRPATRFDVSTRWRHVVDPVAAAEVAAQLASAPFPPTLVVDGGPEVWAAWALTRPLAVDRDPAHAVALLTQLAERVGADVASARDLAGTLPFAGVVRNWNDTVPDRVEIVHATADRYDITALEQALEAGRTQR